MSHYRPQATFWTTLTALLVLVPWINPWSDWPAPNLLPSLVNAVCAALMIGVIVLSRMTRRAMWQAACWGWLIAAIANTLLALLQYFDLAQALHPWVSETPYNQIFGNLRQRNLFATSCAMGLGVLVWHFGTPGSLSDGSGLTRVQRMGATFFAALIGVGLMISNSRTGLIELVLLGVLVLGWSWRAALVSPAWLGRLWMLAVASVAYGLASWLLPTLAGHGANALTRLLTSDGICASRSVIWANMWQLVMQKPWLGWGWGQVGYAHFLTKFDGPRFCGIVDNAHNLPLHLAVTLGLPVASLIVILVAIVIYRAKPWRVTDTERQLAWTIVALIGLHSMLEFPLWYEEFQFAFLLCLWYLYGCHAQGHSALVWLNAPVWTSKKTRAAALALAVGILVASGFVYNSYERVRLFLGPVQSRPPEFAQGVPLLPIDIVLFTHEVSFFQLTADLTSQNAQSSLDVALAVLPAHTNPLTIERIIAVLGALGRIEEARFYEARYQAAFPDQYAGWVAADRKSKFFKDTTRQ